MMAKWNWFFVALALTCSAALGANSDTISLKTASVTIPEQTTPSQMMTPTEKTTHAPATTTTTPKTTTSAPKTTTPAPKTTTPAPKTTTPAPKTTTPAPETTTTPAPKTTTSGPKPTPIPPPAPAPEPSLGVFSFTERNITCIIVQLKAQFNVSYAAHEATLNSTFNLANDSLVVAGSCGNDSQWLTLSWPKDNKELLRNNLTIEFSRNATTNKYHLSLVKVAVAYNATIFPNATSNASIVLQNGTQEWGAGVSSSYRCARSQLLTLTSQSNSTADNTVGALTVSQLQEEAFRTDKGHQFSIAEDCEPGDVPDVVPIAVGCALGGLVLVVLAAYLVGRRRSQARGYLSM